MCQTKRLIGMNLPILLLLTVATFIGAATAQAEPVGMADETLYNM